MARTNLKSELNTKLRNDEKKARLLAFTICANSNTLEDFCEASQLNDCKSMANELIEDVLNIDNKFETALVDGVLRGLATSNSSNIGFVQRRKNFFNTVFKSVAASCPNMIDVNINRCAHIVSRYKGIDNGTVAKLVVYAIMVQYFASYNKIAHLAKIGPNYTDLHFTIQEKPSVIIEEVKVESSISNKQPTAKPEAIANDEVICIPSESESLVNKTVANSTEDESTVGNYIPEQKEMEITKMNEENENPIPEELTKLDWDKMTDDDVKGMVDGFFDEIKDINVPKLKLLQVTEYIVTGITYGKNKKDIIGYICANAMSTWDVDVASIGEFILYASTVTGLLYGDNDVPNEALKAGMSMMRKYISKLIDDIKTPTTEDTHQVEAKPQSTKSNGSFLQSPLSGWLSEINGNKHNGELSKIVEEYNGDVDLSEMADDICRELKSINSLDILDKALDKLQMNMDELVYVLFAMKNKTALASKVRKQVYSVFINAVIKSHKNKDRIMTAVVDTLLKEKGTHPVDNLYPYTKDTEVQTIDKTINRAMGLMKCKIADLSA